MGLILLLGVFGALLIFSCLIVREVAVEVVLEDFTTAFKEGISFVCVLVLVFETTGSVF